MIRKSTLALLAIIFSVSILKSQCTSGIMNSTINVTTVYQTTPVPGGSPSYFQFNGIGGATYFFTYCAGGGNYVGDPYLTVANNVPTALIWNDDFCGLGSNITTWVCPANGLYRIYTSGCCPCGNKSSGSNLAFKYDLPPCSGTPAGSGATCTPLSLCSGNTATLGLTTNYTQPGLTFQWRSAPSGTGPWTNIVGATSQTYSGVMNTTLFYQCIVTCTPSGLSTTSGTVSVVVNPSPTLAISGPTSICAGQSASLAVSGAATYTWSNGSNLQSQIFTPSTTTTYSVIGMTAGCTGTAAVTITVNPMPTVTIAGSNTVCAGALLTLTANGATTYTWNTGDMTPTIGVTPMSNITYSVYGSSNGCTSMAAKSITVSPVPTVTVTGPNAMCVGQTLTLTAFGANSYTWSNGMPTQSIVISPTTTTSYSAYGISPLGCVGPPTVKIINVNPKPNISISTCSGTMCLGEVCTFTANGADSYSWTPGGALTQTIIVSPTVTTNYTVAGTNTTTGCNNTYTMQMMVSPCTGVERNSYDNEVYSIYPNPSNGEFTVRFKDGVAKKITIFDINGREVYQSASESEKVNVNISKLANGIYYLRIEGQAMMVKIVKEK